jgi:choline dehydrogenase-like flavoprotein
MRIEEKVFGDFYNRITNTDILWRREMFVARINKAPWFIRFLSGTVAFFSCRSDFADEALVKMPVIKSFIRFLFGNAELIKLSPQFDSKYDEPNSSRLENLELIFDLVVVGSGPGGSIAALRAAESGKSVLVLEAGSKREPGTVEHHSLHQTAHQFKNGGLNFIWGTRPVLFAEGETVGGGSEVNSGLYHRLDGIHRHRILDHLEISESEWEESESLVEKEIAVQHSPEGGEPKLGLIEGARKSGLIFKEIPRWRKYHPTEEHQSMQVTYLANAQNLGAKVLGSAKVERIVPKEQHIEVIVNADENNISVYGREVVLAAGTIDTPKILNRSGLTADDFELNFHPMIRSVSLQGSSINTGDLFPSWQAWTPDLKFKYGYSVSTYPYLAATLRSLGETKQLSVTDFEKMAAYFASFSLQDSKVSLKRFKHRLVPFMIWGKIDKKNLRLAAKQLKDLLESGSGIEVWPKKGVSPVTTVHLFGSIPLGRSNLIDGSGRLLRDRRIRISDGSLMPFAPWGNPQGPIMVLCELLAKRCKTDG